MPGKRVLAWSLGTAVLVIFLAWPIFSFYQQSAGARHRRAIMPTIVNAGPSEAHASLTSNCQACHDRPFEAVRDSSCKACHVTVHDHADAARLLRARGDLGAFRRLRIQIGAMFGRDAGRCVDCHTEHQGPQRMAPTPQQFCADCHTDLRGRLPDTRLGSASNFETAHPEFQPAVLVQWNGDQPQVHRVALNRRPLDLSNLKFPHALHLLPRGGVAQMGRTLASRYGFGQQLECADCHTPTTDGARFQPVSMEANCGMCHSLSFDQIGGTIRTLRHGEPAQVIADIQSLYRAGGPPRPPELSAGARARPGDVNQIRAAIQFARARSGLAGRSDAAVRGAFSQGGACFDCHNVVNPGPGSLAYRIQPVAFLPRYMNHGWFDHRAHLVVQRPGGPRQTGSQACASCHNAPASNNSGELLLPDLNSCRACHGGERTRLPVPSTCAMCDYHQPGRPQVLRLRARGHRWESTVVPVQPAVAGATSTPTGGAPAGRRPVALCS